MVKLVKGVASVAGGDRSQPYSNRAPGKVPSLGSPSGQAKRLHVAKSKPKQPLPECSWPTIWPIGASKPTPALQLPQQQPTSRPSQQPMALPEKKPTPPPPSHRPMPSVPQPAAAKPPPVSCWPTGPGRADGFDGDRMSCWPIGPGRWVRWGPYPSQLVHHRSAIGMGPCKFRNDSEPMARFMMSNMNWDEAWFNAFRGVGSDMAKTPCHCKSDARCTR